MNEENFIQVNINGKKIRAKPGKTILEITKKNGIDIPTLCYHPDFAPQSTCRLCLIEIKGRKGLFTACSTKAEDGMKINTESPEISRARKINLELLCSQHCEKCEGCDIVSECHLRDLAKKYNANPSRFTDRKNGILSYDFGGSVIFDRSKCINCRNCISACDKQTVNFLEIKEGDNFFEVCPTQNPKRDCIYCGQCVAHCPVDAMIIKDDSADVEKELKNQEKKVVFQFAPSIRTSIGEDFGLPAGSIVTEKLVAGLKKLGPYRVFDTSVGADFTTMEEAQELADKIIKNKGVCFSSCCPSWVKFIEFNYPQFIKNLAPARSPQTILGGLLKTYWAKKEKINPKDIVVVSIMPCTAKKYEINRKELKIGGLKPVDYVLTTRELAVLFKKHKIDLSKIAEEKADNPLGIPSGAGVIYGASGGVAESAMRTAYFKITEENLPNADIKALRGTQGIKRVNINFGRKKVKMAIVNGIGNARKILQELKKNPKAYNAVEVMACPGGCIGGGGQPVPVDDSIRKQRAEALYTIDSEKDIRFAHENPVVKQIYREFLNSKAKIRQICHTRYFPKNKENNFTK